MPQPACYPSALAEALRVGPGSFKRVRLDNTIKKPHCITQAASRRISSRDAHSICSNGSKCQFLNFFIRCFFQMFFGGLRLLNSELVQLFTLLNRKKMKQHLPPNPPKPFPLLEPRIYQRHCWHMPHKLHSCLKNEEHL